MAKIKVTLTNGASPEDISDAIGEFLEQIEQEEKQKAKEQDKEQE